MSTARRLAKFGVLAALFAMGSALPGCGDDDEPQPSAAGGAAGAGGGGTTTSGGAHGGRSQAAGGRTIAATGGSQSDAGAPMQYQGGAPSLQGGKSSAEGGVSNGGVSNGGSAGCQCEGGATGGVASGSGGTWSFPEAGQDGASDGGAAGAGGHGNPEDERVVAIDTDEHATCVLYGSGRVRCWGESAESPTGTFTSIALEGYSACGTLSGGTLDCWKGDLGPGFVTQVRSLGSIACGLRADHQVTCYECNFQAAPTGSGQVCETELTTTPSGTFESVHAGGIDAACGIRSDKTLACWNLDGPLPVPAGTFRSLSMEHEFYFVCAVRDTDGSIECFGDTAQRTTTPPQGAFTQVALGTEYGCALAENGQVVCWAEDPETIDVTPPDARFASIEAGRESVCGMTVDGEPLCWGNDKVGETTLPGGTYTSTVGRRSVCSLKPDGTVACFGPKQTPPQESFERLWSFAETCFCGQRADSSVSCWGPCTFPAFSRSQTWLDLSSHYGIRTNGTLVVVNMGGAPSPPTGTFISVASTYYRTCAVHSDDSVVCWNHSNGDYPVLSTSERLSKIWARNPPTSSAGEEVFCGTHSDGTLACFGPAVATVTPVPSGTFDFVSMGTRHACALRTDHTPVCWGDNDSGQLIVQTEPVRSILAGAGFTCAVALDGQLSCWGWLVR